MSHVTGSRWSHLNVTNRVTNVTTFQTQTQSQDLGPQLDDDVSGICPSWLDTIKLCPIKGHFEQFDFMTKCQRLSWQCPPWYLLACSLSIRAYWVSCGAHYNIIMWLGIMCDIVTSYTGHARSKNASKTSESWSPSVTGRGADILELWSPW